jgi:hypothetical protein
MKFLWLLETVLVVMWPPAVDGAVQRSANRANSVAAAKFRVAVLNLAEAPGAVKPLRSTVVRRCALKIITATKLLPATAPPFEFASLPPPERPYSIETQESGDFPLSVRPPSGLKEFHA